MRCTAFAIGGDQGGAALVAHDDSVLPTFLCYTAHYGMKSDEATFASDRGSVVVFACVVNFELLVFKTGSYSRAGCQRSQD